MHRYDKKVEQWALIRVLFAIGAFSYSLYLFHFPFRTWGGMIAQNLFPFLGTGRKPFVNIAVVMTLSFICYLFFEKPLGQANVMKGLIAPINTIVSGIKLTKRTAFQK
jgi:peptidoglycan/LPS O-acetylase OafA/YrhL